MDLREDYKKEKGRWANVVCSDTEGNIYYTDEYVEWLEEKLVKSLTMPVVSDMLCSSFDADNNISSATKCKCGSEKWEHPKPRN